jgi:hypothetical protein
MGGFTFSAQIAGRDTGGTDSGDLASNVVTPT